ncbi:type IV pilin protein [Desulforegula conservatrix]|uniref:type IV pilin protein n=1 Tax=Desulforegula conservatrix TaxID=153026 RepID=UPI0009FF9B6C|nr:type II secretion system protein [Desulforegula conservatrix]
MESSAYFLKNKNGFTLIEVMVVVAIIGSLAAIAIVNMINYRNKTYCPLAENDAQNAKAALSAYFSIPAHTTLPSSTDLKVAFNNGAPNVIISGDPDTSITIDVTDSTNRCPRGDVFTIHMGGGSGVVGWH